MDVALPLDAQSFRLWIRKQADIYRFITACSATRLYRVPNCHRQVHLIPGFTKGAKANLCFASTTSPNLPTTRCWMFFDSGVIE